MTNIIDITPFQFIVLSLATYRICRLIIQDTITESLRDRLWRRFPPTTYLGYLITCYWCMGIWASSLVFGMYTIVPSPTFAVSLALALSSAVGIVAARVDSWI